MKGIFGSMFDLNHDGNISPLESAMEFTVLNELLKDDSDVQTELELSGLDPDELEFMDADERREALEDQIDAVMQARQKLDAYNGVFISDVVGLGKTYICAMLANTFNRNTYKLFICPPVLVDYWRSVLQEFDVARCDVESLGKLDKIIAKGTDKYTYIFVDEAHRFRNSDALLFESRITKETIRLSYRSNMALKYILCTTGPT